MKKQRPPIHHGIYTLRNGRLVNCPDLVTWARWMAEHWDEWHLRRTEFSSAGTDYFISTVFLGIDHNWFGDEHAGASLLWETRIFEATGIPAEQHRGRLFASAEAALDYHTALELELTAKTRESDDESPAGKGAS